MKYSVKVMRVHPDGGTEQWDELITPHGVGNHTDAIQHVIEQVGPFECDDQSTLVIYATPAPGKQTHEPIVMDLPGDPANWVMIENGETRQLTEQERNEAIQRKAALEKQDAEKSGG